MPRFHPFMDENKKPQLFDHISPENLEKILSCSVIQEHDANKILLNQGDAAPGIFLILEGSVKTLRMNADGEEATIRLLGANDTCLEAVLFMGGPSPITVQTIGKSRLLLIPEKVVKTRVLEDNEFAVNLLRIVTRHYKNAMHQIDAMHIKSPLQRVGYYFLTKHLEAGHENFELKLPFKKQIIANYLGMTPETFSRVLKQLKELGVDTDDNTIRLKDAYALCHFCDADTTALCQRHDKSSCQVCVPH